MTHWEWFAVFAVFIFVFHLNRIWAKLNDVERSIRAIEDRLSEANSSLRSIAYDSEIIRERTPR